MFLHYDRLKFILAVPGNFDLQRLAFGFDRFFGVLVSRVIRLFVAVVMPTITEFVLEFDFEHLLDRLAERGPDRLLSVLSCRQVVLLDKGSQLFFGKCTYYRSYPWLEFSIIQRGLHKLFSFSISFSK